VLRLERRSLQSEETCVACAEWGLLPRRILPPETSIPTFESRLRERPARVFTLTRFLSTHPRGLGADTLRTPPRTRWTRSGRCVLFSVSHNDATFRDAGTSPSPGYSNGIIFPQYDFFFEPGVARRKLPTSNQSPSSLPSPRLYRHDPPLLFPQLSLTTGGESNPRVEPPQRVTHEEDGTPTRDATLVTTTTIRTKCGGLVASPSNEEALSPSTAEDAIPCPPPAGARASEAALHVGEVEDGICAICLDSILEVDVALVKECLHGFCTPCILR